ncbi:MAG: hypothetical protein JST16_06445 [Bdellovibrionales bacterium]|nr:hypothetical protein [Bdellovibrionales bacterium]
MDQSEFTAKLEAYKRFTLPPLEAWTLADHVLQKMKSAKSALRLSAAERDFLRFLLEQSVNLQKWTLEGRDNRSREQAAKKILLGRKKIEIKMREALQQFGLEVKPLKRRAYRSMKECYERLMEEEGKTLEGPSTRQHFQRVTYVHNGKRYKIEWTTPRKKKLEIIRVIKEIFGAKSSGAVIQQLRSLGTKGLPALEGSGQYRPGQRP